MKTLYYMPGACSLAPHIVLELIGEPYKLVKVIPGDPNYAQTITPTGQVPALDNGKGQILTQCSSILRYLTAAHPEIHLCEEAKTSALSIEEDSWSTYLATELHAPFSVLFHPERYTTQHQPEALQAIKDATQMVLRKYLAILDNRLQDRDFIVGTKASYVDIYAIPILNWTAQAITPGLRDYPNLLRHQKKMLENQTVIKVMHGEGVSVRL